MWHAIDTAPKDGKFYLFDSPRWDHPWALRWAKVRNAASMAFVTGYGSAPSYLPEGWQHLPKRIDAPDLAEDEGATRRRIDELEEFLRGVAKNAIAIAGDRK